ncbi:MAG: DNA-binding protein [Brachymonas sp.]|nr:DNA-binding protein [Brachymonas sp.]
MLTVIETPIFQQQAAKVWCEDERFAFIEWIAEHPLAGDVIPGAEGARKVRWAVKGKGKRSGARVIYFYLTEDGAVLLVSVYSKSEQSNITAKAIKRAKS